MNGNIDTERILDAYLAPESERVPDRVIDAALADIARTPQRPALRVPWRFARMRALNRMTAVGIVALVAAVGAGGAFYLAGSMNGGAGSPTARPTVTPAPPETWISYTSARYGFEIAYPAGWTVQPSERDWNLELDRIEWQTPAAERFVAPNSSLLVTAFVDEIPGSVTIEQWLAGYCQAAAGCDLAAAPREAVMIDGHPGLVVHFPTDVEAFTVVRGRVYVVAAWVPTAAPILEEFVSRLKLPG